MSLERKKLGKLEKTAIAEGILGAIGLGVYCLGISQCRDQPINEIIKNPAAVIGTIMFYGSLVALVINAGIHDYKLKQARIYETKMLEASRNV